MILVRKCYFYRYDGGSNGYDRMQNYNLLKNYKNNGDMNIGFTFEEFFEQINGEMKEKSCVFNFIHNFLINKYLNILYDFNTFKSI